MDGDGTDEIVVASSKSHGGFGSARILLFDPVTRRLEGMSPQIIDGSCWEGLADLELADMDGDGDDEILVAADSFYAGAFEAWSVDAAGVFSVVADNLTQLGTDRFQSITASDLNGDGLLEAIVGTSDFLEAYDLTGRRVWTSPMAVGPVTELELADLDGDGIEELVALADGQDLWIFDATTGVLEAIVPGPFEQLEIVPGAVPVALAETSAGDVELVRYLAGAFTTVPFASFTGGYADGFGGVRLAPTNRSIVYYGQGGELGAMRLDGAGEIWHSRPYGTILGADSVLRLTDRELWTTGTFGVVVFAP